MAGLGTPLGEVLGARTTSALRSGLGLETVGDLLRHYPRRYAERGELTPLDALRPDEQVTVLAEVAKVTRRPMRNRRGSLLEVVVTDGSGTLTLTFFNQPWRERDLRVGRRGLFAGKVGVFRRTRQLAHPDYQLIGDEEDEESASAFAGALIPVYPATGRLPSWRIAQCVLLALEMLDPPDDPLPSGLRDRQGLPGLAAALHCVHAPESWSDVRAATHRLKWDEALVLQVALAQRRAAAARIPTRPRPGRASGLLAEFDRSLPFQLTEGQVGVGRTLAAELARPRPMYRLLQGEVGSGKTVVALRAMLAVADSGGQAALLAPTEVLAVQHARSIRQLLGPLGAAGELGGAEVATRVALLTGSLGVAARRDALAAAVDGRAGIVVGTHALLQEHVAFADLGLVVVDEQHRFGVEQRDALRTKAAEPPHVLVMTATPIPRTVAMTVYGDLEVSFLRDLPWGRSPVATYVVRADDERWVARMWGRVRDEVAAGNRVYVVCPRIGDVPGEDDVDDEPEPAEDTPPRRPGRAVLEELPRLAGGELAGLRVAALHGRLPPDEKDDVMRRFAEGTVDVLVATTVIEVGVDVPTATVMVVLDADRFGVSQLHQLRGRVGRGPARSWCLLETEAAPGTPAHDRLEQVAATTDGFVLARVDLEQRREGNVLGAEQAGRRSSLRLLSLLRDEDLILAAREEAAALVTGDPELSGTPALRTAVTELLTDEQSDYLEKA
jgi:ATP-dependent DNA helicase RecG